MNEEVLTIQVGGTVYTAFENAEVTAAFDEAARSFQVTIAAEFGGPATQAIFASGTPITFRAGRDVLLTGYVDRYRPSFGSENASISVTGRSKSQDAIDCSAIHKTGRLEKMDPVAIAKAVSQGLDVEITTDQQLKKVPFYQITLGESVFRMFEKLVRRQGCTVTGTANGGMKATKAGSQRHAGGIIEGKNLKVGDADHDWSNRHSEYILKGQRAEGHGKGALELEAKAKDGAVKRYRPVIVIQRDDTDKETIKKRAETRRDRSAGEATTASITVQGFRDEAGIIWEPGKLVWVESPFLGLAQDMLIKKASFSKSGDGSLTRLDLCDPRAFGGKQGKGNKSGATWDQGSGGATSGSAGAGDLPGTGSVG